MIKRIKIRDFKSIRDVELELGPVTVLIGRSGTGKSNFVQAIRFLRNILLDQNEAIAYELGWERIVPVGEAKPTPTIEVSFTIPGEEREYHYRVAFGIPGQGKWPNALSLLEERLSLGNDLLFARHQNLNGQWEWQQVPAVTPLPNPGSGAPMLGQFPSLQQVVFANAALSTGTGYYHFPAATLSSLANQTHGQSLLQKVPGLSDNASNYLRVIRGITQDFHHPNIRKSILASLRAVNPGIDAVELDSLVNPQRAVIGHRVTKGVFQLSLEQESDGLRRFYAHLLALYQTPAKLVLVFEEPENAIFPGALSLLADEFKAAPGDERGQVILTTHSPILLDSFDVDDIRVVEMREGQTVVGRVSQEQRQSVKEHLLSAGELLTVDKARIDDTGAQPPK